MVKDISWKEWHQAIKQTILDNEKLRHFLVPYFNNELPVVIDFVTKCVKVEKTQRMLLLLHSYGDLAKRVNQAHAISLIFLLALAEGLEKTAQNKENDDSDSPGYIKTFFDYIEENDMNFLNERFTSLSLPPDDVLTIQKLIQILWNIRCNAAHGREYWNFSLPNKNTIEQGIGYITSGDIGKKNNKTEAFFEVGLTFQELFDIFIRTGIKRIKAEQNKENERL